MVEVSKIKLECVKLNNQIKKLYENLGSSIYSMKKSNFENKDIIDSLTEEIDEALANLSELNLKIADIKNLTICNVCGAKNAVTNYYCCKCGSHIKNEYENYEQPQSNQKPDDTIYELPEYDILTEEDETGY
ncbi:MAG: hypothetical protein RSA79_04285 [Oscillospiraceae bacterium]